MRDPNPKISVIMPVYNGGKYLREAIDSILGQTYVNFEFLIIDDGSTDSSVEIIDSYGDPRIQVIHNGCNIGLVKTLNRGLELAKGEYIARMDCDDVSLPQRFENQVAFMDTHPEVGVCGTLLKTIGVSSGVIWDYPAGDAAIRCRLIFESVLAHPSVMMRRLLFTRDNQNYSVDYPGAEDYELWTRLAKVTSLANLEEVLLLYRLHPGNTESIYKKNQRDTAKKIRLNQIKALGLRPTTQEMNLHQDISNYKFQCNRDFIISTESWLLKLKEANQVISYFPEPEFSKVLAKYWYQACHRGQKLGCWTWKTFSLSPLGSFVDISLGNKIRFAARTLSYSFNKFTKRFGT